MTFPSDRGKGGKQDSRKKGEDRQLTKEERRKKDMIIARIKKERRGGKKGFVWKGRKNVIKSL